MNWLIISVGTAIVIALMTALIGPFFVDWSAYKATIEANVSRTLSTEVTLDGEVDLRLLPSPRVRLTNVTLGPEVRPLMQAGEVELDVDLAPLLRGQIRVLDLRITDPVGYLRMELHADDRAQTSPQNHFLSSFFDVENIQVERVAVENGTVVFIDRRSGVERQVSAIDMTGSARTLRGPFTANGSIRAFGEDHDVRLAGGALQYDGRLALSASVTPRRTPITIGFEGTLTPDPSALSLAGVVTAEGTGGQPWALTADAALNTDMMVFPALTLRYGSEDAAAELEGSARYALNTDEPLTVNLGTRQLNLDQLIGDLAREATGDTAATVAAAAKAPQDKLGTLVHFFAPAVTAFGRETSFNIPLSLSLDVEMAVLGGALIRPIVLEAVSDGRRMRIDNLELTLPGDVSLEANGDVTEDRTGPILRTALVLEAQQPGVFARWYTGADGVPLASDTLILEANALVSRETIALPSLSLRAGNTAARGDLRFLRAGTDGRARADLDISLTAPTMDAADLSDLTALAGLVTGGARPALPDIHLDLDVARLKVGQLDGASLIISGTYRDETLTLNTLEVDRLAGATILAQGTLGAVLDAPVGTLRSSVSVPEGAPLAVALRRLFPASNIADIIARRLPDLAPADLNVSLSGATEANAGAPLRIAVDGVLAGTGIAFLSEGALLSPAWTVAPFTASLNARQDDSSTLFAQLGSDGSAVGGGPASLEVSIDGTLADGANANASLSAFGTDATFDGTLRREARWSAAGAADWNSANIAPFLSALGFGGLTAGAANGAAAVAVEGDTVALNELRGVWGETPFAGTLSVSPSSVTGTLDLSAVNLAALAATVLGHDAAPDFNTGPDWSDTPFDAPFDLGRDTAIRVTTPELSLGPLALRNAAFGYELSGPALSVSNLNGELAGGTLDGDVSLTRFGAQTAVDAAFSWSDVPLNDVIWRADGKPVATGTLSVTAALQTAGFNVASLVAGLSGTGSLSVDDLVIARMNPEPIDLDALPALESPEALAAELRRAVAAGLDAGDLEVGSVETAFDVAAGAMRIADTSVASQSTEVTASGTLDVAGWSVRSDWRIGPSDDADAPPPREVNFSGPLDTPARSIDTAQIAAWLSLRQVERQLQAVEAQNQELEAQIRRETGEGPPSDAPRTAPTPVPPVPPAANESNERESRAPAIAPNTFPQDAASASPAANPQDAGPTGATNVQQGFHDDLDAVDDALANLIQRITEQEDRRDEARTQLGLPLSDPVAPPSLPKAPSAAPR